MDIEQEILNTKSQFNKKIQRKMQQGWVIPKFTEYKEAINQQHKFLCKSDVLKLRYCPCCREKWFETELKPGTSMCV